MDNIILIGMPGAGKSTVGVVLAKILGYKFLDSDLVIQNAEKKLLSKIIEDNGIDEFIKIEERVNQNLNVNKTVIATGGSAVYGHNAMLHFKDIGKIIYISIDYKQLTKRLGDIKDRGIAIKSNQTLYDLYLERCPIYEKYADITVKSNNTVTNVINDILVKLK